jgi:hypothetical protein
MDKLSDVEILRGLAEGIDPFTGEVLAGESPYNRVETVRALYKAIELFGKGRNEKRRSLPERAGQAWTEEESGLLAKRFDEGMEIGQIAKEHQRTRGSIAARLVKIGKITERAEVYIRGERNSN